MAAEKKIYAFISVWRCRIAANLGKQGASIASNSLHQARRMTRLMSCWTIFNIIGHYVILFFWHKNHHHLQKFFEMRVSVSWCDAWGSCTFKCKSVIDCAWVLETGQFKRQNAHICWLIHSCVLNSLEFYATWNSRAQGPFHYVYRLPTRENVIHEVMNALVYANYIWVWNHENCLLKYVLKRHKHEIEKYI